MAVGTPRKLGWYCMECGSDMAKIALAMNTRQFDGVEKRAAEFVATEAGGDINVSSTDAPAFVLWVIEQFSNSMRKEIEGGGPPF